VHSGTTARGKRLRGTWLDPFGRAEVRKVERELRGEYLTALDKALDSLSARRFTTS